jgi:hypothetical protein
VPLIDKTIAVYYEDGKYYRGFVRTYSVERARYMVRYEDGEELWHIIDETTGKIDRKKSFVVCPSEDWRWAKLDLAWEFGSPGHVGAALRTQLAFFHSCSGAAATAGGGGRP